MNSPGPASPLSALPIDEVLPSLIQTYRDRSAVVLHAPPGAGKTSRVPPALLAAIGDLGRILLLEPRRLAARSAARRIAAEQGWKVGAEIGYQVRFENRASAASRIIAMTDGVLLRRLQDDPFLEGIACVVFDEFHERRLDCDLALGMVRRIQQTVRPDLRIVVMSATLTAGPLVEYLGDCGAVTSAGRLHPVSIRYAGTPDRRPLPARVADAVQQLLASTRADLLVFLPGLAEIRRTARELEPLARQRDLLVTPLYGDMSPEAQDDVLRPHSRRKIVLATNVAETSVTIEGVTGVIDSGLARVMRFDPRVGLDRLERTPISRASADQRAGRAGRLEPGECLRLWDERTQRHRCAFETAEIHRVDLSGAVLQLRCWGEADILAFPWFEPPAPERVRAADALLRSLGALDESGVTELGRRLVRLPVHPRLARLVLEGAILGVPERAALAAALLSERDPFRTAADPPPHPTGGHGDGDSHPDIVDRVATLEQFERSGHHAAFGGRINASAAGSILRSRDQLLRLVRQELRTAGGETAPELTGSNRPARNADDLLRRALLAAYPDRLARRRSAGDPRGVMVGRRGVRLTPGALAAEGDLFLCIDVDDAGTEALVRVASVVERDWLPSQRLRVAEELFFHPDQRQVMARRRTYWEDLLLEETPTAVIDRQQAAELLFAAAAREWTRVFPEDDPEVGGFVARARCLREWMPELALPAYDEVQLRDVLRTLCEGRQSFSELRRAPWLSALQALLAHDQRRVLEREAPERLAVPSGSRIRLVYQSGRAPVLAVRIQEVFGLRQTPRIAGGRVRVLLHLLGPNMRPQQITDDLESFWATTYPRIRGELRRRYPKHAWPDDPLSAPPIRGPRRRE